MSQGRDGMKYQSNAGISFHEERTLLLSTLLPTAPLGEEGGIIYLICEFRKTGYS